MHQIHILIVDDDEACRISMGVRLSGQGHIVQVAHDGASALELAKRLSFDLLISDFEMPGMNGVELFKQVSQMQPAIAGILVSGEMPDSRKNAAFAAGMLAAHDKLLDNTELLALISAACVSASQEIRSP